MKAPPAPDTRRAQATTERFREVKLLSIDEKGRLRLSRRAAMAEEAEQGEGEGEAAAAEPAESGADA